MRKLIIISALFSLTSFGAAQEPVPASTRGEVAGYASRDATVLSVMGWGISLAVGFAALCALIDNSTTSSHTH